MAARVDLPSLPQFDPHADATSLAKRWEQWLKRFRIYLRAGKITDKTQQRALLLYMAGPEVQAIFETITDTGDDDDFQTAIDKLSEYFMPKKNLEYEAYIFRQARQSTGETLDQYHTRLRKLATTCEFADIDREIKTQIIQSCTSTRLRRKALRDSTLTLTTLLAEGRSIEITEKQVKGIEKSLTAVNLDESSELDTSLNAIREQQPPPLQRKCYFCGFDFPHKNNRCPAYGKECSLCHKMNHFAKVCKGGQKRSQNQRQVRSDSRRQPQRNPTSVNAVVNEYSAEESNSSSDDEYVYTVDKTSTAAAQKAKSTTKVKINGTNIQALIDTGASINILDEHTFDNICKQKPIHLRRSKARVFAYASQSPLPMAGVFEEVIEAKRRLTTAKFHVVKGSHGNLICSETAAELGLVTLSIHNIKTDQREGASVTQPAQPSPHTPVPPVLPCSTAPSNNTNDTFVQKLTNEYQDLFEGIGCLKDFELKLHIDPTVKPTAQRERRIPFHIREKVNQELDKLTQQGIIEPCTGPTPWVSPLVATPKPKSPNEVRICVDMRLPNTAIIRERHPMPTADELTHKLNGAKVFSKLDLRHGYHQILLAPESRYITTFRTHKGLHRYVRLNYGTSSASEVFQHAISQVIAGIDGTINISDDILIFGSTQVAHDTALKKVFERLRQVGLTLNKSKCAYNKKTLEFFGMIFSANGVSPDPKKIEAIVNAPRPTTVSGVRSLLGMTNYLSKFISNYASITTPLRQLTKKNARFEWLPAHETSWNALVKALTSAPVMAYFDTNTPTELIVDASPTGLGAILQQLTPDKQTRKVIAYASRSLSPVERRYSQTEREALAIVWAMERFHIYLYGTEFVLYTDHKPLELICNNPKSTPPARIERWFLRLQKYLFTVRYRPGVDNPSDYMSRHPLPQSTVHKAGQKAEEYINFIAQHSTPKSISLKDIKQQTKADATLQLAIKCLRSGKWHEIQNVTDLNINKQELAILYSVRCELTAGKDDDILLKSTRIVLPTSLRNRAINLAHEGHQGLTKTKQLIREKIWFPSIDAMVKKIIDGCIPCQSALPAQPQVPLKMSNMPPTPWHTVHIDFLGPFPTGELLVVVIDAYSRYPEVEVVRSTAASVLIPKLDRIFSTHGMPYKVIADNGPPFNGHEIKKYMEIHGIEFTTTTPLWPQGNSEAESFMKPLLKSVLTARTEGQNWKKELYTFLLNYRATPHSTTRVPPAELLFNRAIRTKLPQAQDASPQPLNKHKAAKDNDEKSKTKMKMYGDHARHAKNRQINCGDLVLCKQQKKNKFSTKFNPAPYKVIKVKGSTVTAQRHSHQLTRNISHFKRLNTDQAHTSHDDDDLSTEEEDEITTNARHQEDEEEVRRYPARDRQQTNFYHDPNSAILSH